MSLLVLKYRVKCCHSCSFGVLRKFTAGRTDFNSHKTEYFLCFVNKWMTPDSRREKWASIYTQLKLISGEPSHRERELPTTFFLKVNHNLKHIINLKT